MNIINAKNNVQLKTKIHLMHPKCAKLPKINPQSHNYPNFGCNVIGKKSKISEYFFQDTVSVYLQNRDKYETLTSW